MSTAVDERAARQARARARAAAILDTPNIPRSFLLEHGIRLQGSDRRRLHGRRRTAARPPARAGHGHRTTVILLAVIVQAFVLAALLLHPAFRIQHLDVSGERMLSAPAIERLTGLHTGSIIFTVDGEGVRRRLLADPWIADAHVETALPGTVRLTITERTAVMRVKRPGVDELVAAGGQTITVSDVVAGALPLLPVLSDERRAVNGAPPRLDPSLLALLASTSSAFPTVVGVPAAGFAWGADGVLQIRAATGWSAVLGHVDDPAAIEAIPRKLAALAALKGRVDFAKPTFGYVNLEDPDSVAVGGSPAPANPAPVASPAPAAAPRASAPAAAAAPAARPAPTPVVVPSH